MPAGSRCPSRCARGFLRILLSLKRQHPALLAGFGTSFNVEPRSQLAAVAPRSAIVTARRPGARSSVDVPDMTLEEHQRRGDAADTLFREIVRRATGKP